jgi:hypothetical protein
VCSGIHRWTYSDDYELDQIDEYLCSVPSAKKSPPFGDGVKAGRILAVKPCFVNSVSCNNIHIISRNLLIPGSYNKPVRAINELPANYQHHKTLNLSETKTVLWLNLAAIPLLFVYAWLFTLLINLNNDFSQFAFGRFDSFVSFSGWSLVTLLISVIIMLILHELIHGLFFFLFTHHPPRFAVKSGYAFAAAPGWFIPSGQYIWVGLSPFVIISLICVILGWVFNPVVVHYLLIIATFNAAGSLGDMIVVGWVLKQSSEIYVMDDGDIFRSYGPGQV